MALLAYDLDSVTATHIVDGLESAGRVSSFVDAGNLVIRTIHSLPRLFRKSDLGRIEVYLGRAGFSPQHVLARFREHRDNKGHEHGVVLFSTTTHRVVRWEGFANKILTFLRDNGTLCVANASTSGQGGIPQLDDSCVYLTWCRVPDSGIVAPDADVVAAAAVHLNDTTDGAVAVEDAVDALAPLTRPNSETIEIAWHPDHAE